MKTKTKLLKATSVIAFLLLQVNSFSQPTANAGQDMFLCSSQSIVIGGNPTGTGGTPPYTYSWSPSTGLSSTTVANPTATPPSTITYIVTVYDNVGASATDDITITIANPISVTATPTNPTICMGDSVALTASGATTYSWSPSTGLSSSTEATVYASPTSTTTYTVIGSDAMGCTGSTTVTVNVIICPGIEENTNSDNIHIVSQPDKNLVTISFDNTADLSNSVLTIYDIKGETILKTQLFNKSNDINLSGLAKGYYVFKIDNDSQAFIKKIYKE